MVESILKMTSRGLMVFVAALFMSGCSHQEAYPTFMHPELLYLKDQPYTKLYVEVDMVEGAEVPQQWLDELRDFLAQYCDKPDGITIVKDDPIPLAEVKDLTVGEAALLCTDGPRVENGPQPAYLHVFFYNQYPFKFKGHEGLSGPTWKPHVISFFPNTIFFNRCYVSAAPEYTQIEDLEHEAGHILGLGKGKSHGDGSHCRNRGCLMLPYEGFVSENVRLLTGPFGVKLRHHPCQDCLHDLEEAKAMEPDEKLSFAGPFLVRREDGYSVASLPYCEVIEISQHVPFNWQEALDHAKGQMRRRIAAYRPDHDRPPNESGQLQRGTQPKKGMRSYVYFVQASGLKESTPEVTEQAQTALTKATQDPCPVTRAVAHAMLEELTKKPARPAPAAATPETQ